MDLGFIHNNIFFIILSSKFIAKSRYKKKFAMYYSDFMKAVMVMQMWYKVQILFKDFLRKCEVVIFWKFSFLIFEIEIYEKNALKSRIWHCKVLGNQLWKTFQIVDSHTHLTRSGYLRIELVAFYQDTVEISSPLKSSIKL